MNGEEIFHEFLARTGPEDREAYLQQVCAGNPALRASVEALLRANHLHRWEVEDHHGPIGDPNDMPPGNGLLLWFEVDDIDSAIARAEAMGAEVILPRHRKPVSSPLNLPTGNCKDRCLVTMTSRRTSGTMR